MSKQEPKKDQYIRSLFEEAGTEEPSKNFTNNIIDAIKNETATSPYTYRPIISKSAWLTIAFIGVAAFLILMFLNPTSSEGLNLYGYSVSLDLSKVLHG